MPSRERETRNAKRELRRPFMQRVFLILILICIVAAPASLSLASDSRTSTPTNNGALYNNDPRFGESKDVSDKFTFVRIMHGQVYPGQYLGDHGIPWSHDYPEAGQHFSKILSELSKLPINIDMVEYLFSFRDPNLFKYPFAYLCEVGDMTLSDEEIAGMKEYLSRGGFLLIDDFRGGWDFSNLAINETRVSRVRHEATRHLPPDIQLLLFDQVARCAVAIRQVEARVLGPGRQGWTADGDHKLQQRCERLLAVVERPLSADRRYEHGLQVRRQLRVLCADALKNVSRSAFRVPRSVEQGSGGFRETPERENRNAKLGTRNAKRSFPEE